MSASLRRLLRRAVKPPLHVARRVAFAAVRRWLARRPAAADGNRVYFLLQHAYGMGGTIRAVLDLAGHLAQRHEVEVISVVRQRERPFFPFPDGVAVRSLLDRTSDRPRGIQTLLARLPSVLVHEEDGAFGTCSALTDLRLARTLRELPKGVLVTTRPAFSLLAAELAAPQLTVIAHEHVSHRNHRPGLARAVRRGYPALPAVVALTEADRRFYADLCADAPTRVAHIPNGVRPMSAPRADRQQIVVSAGRLVRWKRFDLLVDAFADATADHPGWRLHIFGSGPERDRLRARIVERGLTDRAELKGRSKRLDREFGRSEIFALSSPHETFGLVLVEAMSCGLPVVAVSTDGPAEVVTPGVDGLLVPDTGVAAFASALRELIGDPGRRARMGAAAAGSARRYDIDVVGAGWERLLSAVIELPTPG